MGSADYLVGIIVIGTAIGFLVHSTAAGFLVFGILFTIGAVLP